MENITALKNKILLSIAIPTYNGAAYLKELLGNIVLQAKELKGQVEICISNNNSPDNTREVAMEFEKKYPDLVKYRENEKNLGAERNMIEVLKMAQGDFVWFFGDDDSIIPTGLREVVNFIENNCKKNTGLVALCEESYFIDEKTGKKTAYYSSFKPNKPEALKLSREVIIDGNFPSSAFMTVLIFKNSFLKKLLGEEKELIEKAVGSEYMPMFLYRLMFLKFYNIEGLAFNKNIIVQDIHCNKLYMEDKFRMYYVSKKRLNELLLSSGYADDTIVKRFAEMNSKFRRDVVQHIILMKTFKTFFYYSYFGLLKKFFRQSMFKDGLMISFIFLIASLTPSFVLKIIIKVYFLLKYGKKWKTHWTFCYVAHCEVARSI